MARKTLRKKQQQADSGTKKGSKSLADKWAHFRLTLTHNRTNLRSLGLLASVMLIVVFGISGFTHAHHVQQVRAMTVSSVNKHFTFSKTGNSAKLLQQYHNGNLYVIPIKFDSTNTMATNAGQYKVFFKESIQKKKYALPANLKANFVVFGGTGYTAVVIYGDLPRAPLQVLIRDDMPINSVDFADGAGQVVEGNGDGMVQFDGRNQKVDFDGAAFKINPKGNNVKTDPDIERTMDLASLYNVIVGKNRVAKANAKIKKLNYAQSQNLSAQKQYYNQLAQVNKALDRPADDTADTSGDTSANANTTLDQNRTEILQNISNCKENTQQYTSSVQQAKADKNQVAILIKSMNNYATMSSRWGLL